jgi:hydroxymethylglutaryl-CoA lyase
MNNLYIPKNYSKFSRFIKQHTPSLFDVSLRDGIQTSNEREYPFDTKKNLFMDIMGQPILPQSMEIGSLASPKFLPIMKDSLKLHYFANEVVDIMGRNIDMYLLIPSLSKVYTALDNGVTNMSFITSVSNSFQMKNTNKCIDDTKQEFRMIEQLLPDHINKKLYISCINECPVSGIIPLQTIIKEIAFYAHNYDFDQLCLSDTCGTLNSITFSNIVRELKYIGVPMNKLSIHLHVQQHNVNEEEALVFKCIEYGINKFDVSALNSGGCPVIIHNDMTYLNSKKTVVDRALYAKSMRKHRLNRNLSYADLMKIFDKWAEHHYS